MGKGRVLYPLGIVLGKTGKEGMDLGVSGSQVLLQRSHNKGSVEMKGTGYSRWGWGVRSRGRGQVQLLSW